MMCASKFFVIAQNRSSGVEKTLFPLGPPAFRPEPLTKAFSLTRSARNAFSKIEFPLAPKIDIFLGGLRWQIDGYR